MFELLRKVRTKAEDDSSKLSWLWYAAFTVLSLVSVVAVVRLSAARASKQRQKALLNEQAKILRARAAAADTEEETARLNEAAEKALHDRSELEKKIERSAIEREALAAAVSKSTSLQELDDYYERLR